MSDKTKHALVGLGLAVLLAVLQYAATYIQTECSLETAATWCKFSTYILSLIAMIVAWVAKSPAK